MVADQSRPVERSLPSTNSASHYIRRRKQPRLGRYLSRKISSGPLNARRSQSVYQFEKTQSNRSQSSLLPRTARHHCINTHQQQHRKIKHKSTKATPNLSNSVDLPQQYGRDISRTAYVFKLNTFRELRTKSQTMLLATSSRRTMVDSSFNLPEDSNPLWRSRHPPFRRSHIHSTSSVCLLETGPGRPSNGCPMNTMVPVSEHVPQPTVEPDTHLPQETLYREGPPSDACSAILAESNLVSSASEDGDGGSYATGSTALYTNHSSSRDITMDKQRTGDSPSGE